MIAVEKSPDNVLAIRLSGTVEESDIERMEEAFKDKLNTADQFGLVVDMTDWSDITGDAIAEDTKFEFGLLSKLSRFPRMALVSDKQFPQALARFLDPLFPSVAIRTFAAKEHDDAIAFASELPEAQVEGTHGLTLIDTGNPKVIGFEIDGMLTKEDVERVIQPLQQAFESEEKIDLLARVKSYRGLDLSLFIDKSFLSMKLTSISHVRRYAVVGAPNWLENVGEMVGSALPIDMHFFDTDEEDEAWAWLKS